jgi:hypothetical protein
MRECVTTAMATVLVNGSPAEEFPLKWGLRQVEPLSPFSFLVAAEGFHVIMEDLVNNNIFTGYKVRHEQTLSVSHLQFADDTLIVGNKR